MLPYIIYLLYFVLTNQYTDVQYDDVKIKLIEYNNSNDEIHFEKGERLAQLVIIPIITFSLVDSLKTRGSNGLGSSGK